MSFALKDTADINISQNADSATKLESVRQLDGFGFDGTAGIVRFATCISESDEIEKVVDVTGFNLVSGAIVFLTFTNTNTATNPTLNVNNTGAKNIYFGEHRVTDEDLTSKHVYVFVYDGTQYLVVNGGFTIYVRAKWGTIEWSNSEYP